MNKKSTFLKIWCAILLIGLTSCNLPMLKYLDGFHENYRPSPDVVLKNTFTYSPAQLIVIRDFGYPTRFTIIFSEENRQETWIYDNFNYQIAFIDGEKIADQENHASSETDIFVTNYRPDQFYRGMGIDEIVLSTESNDFALSSYSEMVENGRLMHLKGLSIGLINGVISFVEIYPTKNVEITIESVAKNNVPLTHEEQANEGIHDYSILFYIDNEFDRDTESTIEIAFRSGEACVTEDDKTHCYKRSSKNEYVNEDETIRINFSEDGFIRYSQKGTLKIKAFYTLSGK